MRSNAGLELVERRRTVGNICKCCCLPTFVDELSSPADLSRYVFHLGERPGTREPLGDLVESENGVTVCYQQVGAGRINRDQRGAIAISARSFDSHGCRGE